MWDRLQTAQSRTWNEEGGFWRSQRGWIIRSWNKQIKTQGRALGGASHRQERRVGLFSHGPQWVLQLLPTLWWSLHGSLQRQLALSPSSTLQEMWVKHEVLFEFLLSSSILYFYEIFVYNKCIKITIYLIFNHNLSCLNNIRNFKNF